MSRRPAEPLREVGGQLSRVLAHAVDEGRLAPPEEVEADYVKAGERRDPAVVPDLAGLVEDGDLQPRVAPPEPRGPDHAADALRVEVHRRRRVRRPQERDERLGLADLGLQARAGGEDVDALD